MTTIAHKDLTGADLHEPKGVATATAGAYYRADGAGSGTWTPLVLPTGLFKVSTTTFTASGTWTKPAGCFFIKILLIGTGGGASSVSVDGTTAVATTFGSYFSAAAGEAATTIANGAGGAANTFADISFAGMPGTGTTGTAVGGETCGPFGSIACPTIKYGKGADNSASGFAGGGGAYAEKWFDASTVTSSVFVEIGTGGSPVATGTGGLAYIEEFCTL